MRVTVISHAYQDDRYLTTWDAMTRFPGVEIALIYPRRYKGLQAKWHEVHPVEDLRVPVFLDSRQGAFVYRPQALQTALDHFRPDLIVHEQEVYALGAVQVAAVARRRSIPLVQFVWENVDRKLALPRRLFTRYVLTRTTAIIAGSAQAKHIHERWGFRGEITVLPQMSVRTVIASRFEMRKIDALTICYVGRLVSCKGIDCLLRAIAILHRHGFDVQCAIAGNGPERPRLAALARELGIWTLVQFHGHLAGPNVRQLMQASHVLVLPSRRTQTWEEQFGLVLAEAMAEGTVTVGSRTGAIPEVIGTEQLLFAENDATELAEILRKLAIDPEFYLWSRVHGLQRARQRFKTDCVADKKLAFLRDVLDRGPLPINQPIAQAISMGMQ